MREPLRDPSRLEHILEAIERITMFTQDATEDSLNSDIMRKHATAYNIQIIGEAAYKLTKEFKISHPSTPWAMIEKMRHILVHDYFRVNAHNVAYYYRRHSCSKTTNRTLPDRIKE